MSLARIYAMMRNRAWDDAISECEAALQLQPINPNLWGCLGMCHFRKGEYELAIVPFHKASALDPSFFEAGTKLAQCYDRLKRYEEAYETAREWLAIRPSDHTLQGLVAALKYQVKGNRTDGWERTAHLTYTIIFTEHDD
jgi:tetratricopeptide (TPR) repeat protein